jgi:LysR family transcriptional regulator (chromosome initiation inhibitor)
MKLISANLQAFYFTATFGTVHAAATRLNITQTAATRRIAALEKDLKKTLFLRSRKGMALTESGRGILRYCKQVLEIEGEVLVGSESNPAEAEQRLTIEVPSSFLRTRILTVLSKLRSEYPRLILDIRVDDDAKGVEALKLGKADIVVIPSSEVAKEFDSKKLKPEQYIMVGPVSWGSRKIEDIVRNELIVDFGCDDKMTINYLNHFGLQQLMREERHFINNTDALARAVEMGIGYSVLSREFADPLIQQNRLICFQPRKHFEFFLALAWYPRKYIPDYMKGFISALK